MLRGLAAVAEAGLPYDVVCSPSQLPAAVTAAAALPQLTFVLDHLGNPEGDEPGDGPWASAVRALAALPNTVGKLSGVLSEAFPVGGAPPAGPGRGRDRPARAAVLRHRARRVRAAVGSCTAPTGRRAP